MKAGAAEEEGGEEVETHTPSRFGLVCCSGSRSEGMTNAYGSLFVVGVGVGV